MRLARSGTTGAVLGIDTPFLSAVSTCPDHLPSTPDGRYFVHKGILWRCSNPDLSDDDRQRLVRELMSARRDVGVFTRAGDSDAERDARARVHTAKVALGERGPTWWNGEDYNRKKPENTPYAEWWASRLAHKGESPLAPEAG